MYAKPSFRCHLLAWLIVAAGGASASAQPINPDLLTSRWKAHWIRPVDAPPRSFGVYHFRRSFDLPSVPSSFVIHTTADNRYELFVNGTRVVTGPARGDLDHWRFETVDIARLLRAGRNVMAAVVWNFAGAAPMAQVTYETGLLDFLLRGELTITGGPAIVVSAKGLGAGTIDVLVEDDRGVRKSIGTAQTKAGTEELVRLPAPGAGTRIVAVFRGADNVGEPIVAVGALALTAQ